jgi:predicted transcriptional regulator
MAKNNSRIEEIRDLIEQGYTHRKIAEILDISKSAVSYYATKHKLAHSDPGYISGSEEKVECLSCGVEFFKIKTEVKRSPNHFCTSSCAAKYNNRKRNLKNTLPFIDEERKQIIIKTYRRLGERERVAKELGEPLRLVVEILNDVGEPMIKHKPTEHPTTGQLLTKTGKSWYKHERNSAAFANPIKSAYWVGFMMTDGYVSKDKSVSGLYLSAVDDEHVLKYKSFLGYQGNLTYTKDDQVAMFITDDKIKEDLIRWGVTPQKTFTASPHPSLMHNHDFWRGAIDGDGSILKLTGGHRTITMMAASKSMMEAFQAYLEKLYEKEYDIYESCHDDPKRQIQYHIGIHGFQARHLATILYDNAPQDQRLERKYERARALIDTPYKRAHLERAYQEFSTQYSIV